MLLLASRVARTDATVLLTGESGTGKEVFTRHSRSIGPRRKGPFVAINCAAIPDNLLEATLFGHERAFTGAGRSGQQVRAGQRRHPAARRDFEMPLALQAKLLQVLQEREVERVGGKETRGARYPGAGDLEPRHGVGSAVQPLPRISTIGSMSFRWPYRRYERRGDILPLARHFLALHGSRLGQPAWLVDK